MVVPRRVLGTLVRQTAVNMGKRRRLDHDRYLTRFKLLQLTIYQELSFYNVFYVTVINFHTFVVSLRYQRWPRNIVPNRILHPFIQAYLIVPTPTDKRDAGLWRQTLFRTFCLPMKMFDLRMTWPYSWPSWHYEINGSSILCLNKSVPLW